MTVWCGCNRRAVREIGRRHGPAEYRRRIAADCTQRYVRRCSNGQCSYMVESADLLSVCCVVVLKKKKKKRRLRYGHPPTHHHRRRNTIRKIRFSFLACNVVQTRPISDEPKTTCFRVNQQVRPTAPPTYFAVTDPVKSRHGAMSGDRDEAMALDRALRLPPRARPADSRETVSRILYRIEAAGKVTI
ncbi:hypothetical protein AGLY_003630 [Aphis glycines]|uniref:Uncharacterized protein n=1 Tax=Aphis glycines TaxID=307491 RepID=A0A6G0TYR3_APHGL|nr:hypothetical protein AGLY_003630 [Aphis glycines]